VFAIAAGYELFCEVHSQRHIVFLSQWTRTQSAPSKVWVVDEAQVRNGMGRCMGRTIRQRMEHAYGTTSMLQIWWMRM